MMFYMAQVGMVAAVVPNGMIDVMVTDADVLSLDIDSDGREVLVYGCDLDVVFGPVDTSVPVTGDPGNVLDEVERILNANGYTLAEGESWVDGDTGSYHLLVKA